LQRNKATIKLHKPDLKEKFFFFISGLIISVPFTFFFASYADYLTTALPALYASLLSIVIFAPLIEEFAKAYPLFYRHGETERSIFVLGLLVGLGFGIFEFLGYTLALGVSIWVRLPVVFFHAATTSVTAYGITRGRPARFYLLAVVLHLLYNLFALDDVLYLIGSIPVLVITFSLAWVFYHRTSEKMIKIKK